MLPVITVDEAKCTDPLNCRKCLLACPTRVLEVVPKVHPKKYQEIDPKNFHIKAVHLLSCSICLDCANVCPQQAINIKANRG